MKKRKPPRPVTIYELIIWSYRLPSVRRMGRAFMFPRGWECLYTFEALADMDEHEHEPGLFGRN